MEKAIGTTFAFFRSSNGHMLLGPNGTVQFSKAIPVSSIADAVVDPAARWKDLVHSPAAPSQNTLSGYSPGQVATAFDFKSAYNAGITGSGITIGIIGTGPAMAIDWNTYKTQYAVGGAGQLSFPAVNANSAANAQGPNPPYYQYGGSPTSTPPPVTAECNGPASSPIGLPPSESPTPQCNPEDYEAQIDTEQATLAPDANVEFYLAYVASECNTAGSNSCAPDPSTGLGYAYQGLAISDDEIQQIIADNTADVVSGSYGGPEIGTNYGYVANFSNGYDPTALLPAEMAALAVEGIATFFSTGDDGAQSCANYPYSFDVDTCVSSPASDANVTAVGGLTVPLTNAGTYLGPITGWGQQTFFEGSGGASGGGVSCYTNSSAVPWEVQPSYETGTLLQASGSDTCQTFGNANTGGRVLPDISLLGDSATGVGVVSNIAFGGTTQNVYGGTSVAAPEMAAMWALVLQACSKEPSCATATGAKAYRLGNAAPLLWKVYQSQTTYASTIYDVTFGNNGVTPCLVQQTCSVPQPLPSTGYSAGAGWDAVTGLGAPFARHLITAITGY
jgi:subtilase family serine protease